MLRTPLFALTLSAACAFACTKDDASGRSEPGVGEPPPVTPAASTAEGTSGGVAAPSPGAPVETAGSSVVAQRTGFYKTASKDSKVPDPSGKGQMTNWISLLQRGDSATVLRTEGEYSEIEVSGGARGFVPSNTLLTSPSLTAATTQEAIVIFDRPDPVAVSKTRLEPGSLVFVISKKERFAEVNVRGTKTSWVLADQLDTGADEVQVARMIEKARYLIEKEKGEGTKELVEVARATFPSAKLLPALQALVEGPAAAASPTASPAPAAGTATTTAP